MASKSLGDLIIRIMGENSSFSDTLKQSEQSLKAFSDKAVQIGKNLSLAITAPLLAIGGAAVKGAADIETLGASFEVLTGSATEAASLLKQIREFAGTTPFETKDLAESAKTLLAFGVNGKAIMPTLKTLGDIALGDSEKLKQLALVFGQVSSTGRLMGQDLLQLINAGFNPLQEISKKTGESIATLKDRMEKGGISALEVGEAFKSATAEGGRFYEGAKRLGETFSGKLSTLKDDAINLGISFAEILLPTLKNLIKSLSDAVAWFTNLDTPTKEMIVQMALVAASIGPLIGVIGSLGTALSFLAANPVVLALAAIAGLVAVITYANKEHERELELLNKKNKAVYDNRDAVHSLLDPIIAEGKNRKLTGEEIDKLLKIYPNLTKVVDRNNLTAQDAAKLAEIQSRVDAFNVAMLYRKIAGENDLAIAIERRRIKEWESFRGSKQFGDETLRQNEVYIKKGYEQIKVMEAQSKAYNDQITALGKITAGTTAYTATKKEEVTITDDLVKGNNDLNKAIELTYQSMSEGEETAKNNDLERMDRIIAITKEEEAQAKAILEKANAQRKAKEEFEFFMGTAKQFAGQIQSIFSGIFDLQRAEVDSWLQAQLEAQGLAHDDAIDKMQKELDAAIAAGDTEKANDIEKDIAKKKLEDEATKRKKKIMRDEAIANKILAITNIIIDTAKAVAALLAFPPAAIAAGVLGAAQLGIVAAQPIPELADGGIVPATQGGRIVRVAEAGQAEAIIPLNKAAQMGFGDSGNMHLVVNLDSRPFLDKIFPASKNRTILIDQGAIV